MKKRGICILIFFTILLFLDVYLPQNLKEELQFQENIQKDHMIEQIRDQQISLEMQENLLQEAGEEKETYPQLLLGYFCCDTENIWEIRRYTERFRRRASREFEEYSNILAAVWNDLDCFPVPESDRNPDAGVSYGDSWMQGRSFGGNRRHEGCDIMADLNVRGVYPVLSITDGTIEKIGWLKLGGYRIGIRSPSGAYFYYAHLASYATDFKEGDPVTSGTLLGFMGDTGYSEIEGTTGNFDVHLHVGIYVMGTDGKEWSVNPYWVLRSLETRKRVYHF